MTRDHHDARRDRDYGEGMERLKRCLNLPVNSSSSQSAAAGPTCQQQQWPRPPLPRHRQSHGHRDGY
jgi:hypothetical protein